MLLDTAGADTAGASRAVGGRGSMVFCFLAAWSTPPGEEDEEGGGMADGTATAAAMAGPVLVPGGRETTEATTGALATPALGGLTVGPEPTDPPTTSTEGKFAWHTTGQAIPRLA